MSNPHQRITTMMRRANSFAISKMSTPGGKRAQPLAELKASTTLPIRQTEAAQTPAATTPRPEPRVLDERVDLQGRVVILKAVLKTHREGDRAWYVTCTNREALKKGPQPASGHITMTGTSPSKFPLYDLAMNFLENDLRLSGVKLDFEHDLVFLDGVAAHTRPPTCGGRGSIDTPPGLPLRLTAFLNLFKRQLVGPEEFKLVTRNLQRGQYAGGVQPNYCEIFFPEKLDRDIVLCVNWGQTESPFRTENSLRRLEKAGLRKAEWLKAFNQLKPAYCELEKLCAVPGTDAKYSLFGIALIQ